MQIISRAHLNRGCAPPGSLSKYLERTYYGIPRGLVKKFIRSCPICLSRQQLATRKKKPNVVIRSKSFAERFQVDLIDMRSVSAEGYNYSYILHLKDYTSLLSRAVAISDKSKGTT